MTRLLLVPTRLELELLTGSAAVTTWAGWDVAVVGMGPADAAAGTAAALSRQAGARSVLLVGLGGTLSPHDVPVGSVVAALRFRQWGIGAGLEPNLVGLAEMGLPAAATGDLPLLDVEDAAPFGEAPRVEMLSVCAASASTAQARDRAARFPQARVEEMEGWAVARAARLFGVRVTCLRAIGNVAGERDKARWRTAEAMATLASALDALPR